MNQVAGEAGALHLAIGWLEPGSTRRDAVDYARGYAQKYFDSVDACWYAVMPFMDGWFYEVQEGGSGKSYLPAVARALSSGQEGQWIRVGTRVMSIGLREGRPFCVLMSEADSRLMTESDGRLVATSKMQRVVRRGMGVLLSGLVVAVSGFMFLISAGGFYLLQLETYVPSVREIDMALLPHLQWDRVGSVPPNLYVEKLELPQGGERWETQVKPIQRQAVDGQAPATSIPETIVQELAAPATPEPLPVGESPAPVQDGAGPTPTEPSVPVEAGPAELPAVVPVAPLPAIPAAIPAP